MTDEMMTLRSMIENSPDADLLREMIGFTAERLWVAPDRRGVGMLTNDGPSMA